MVDIQSPAAEIRRGKKKTEDRRRKKLQGKNIMAPLLHRAAIKTREFKFQNSGPSFFMAVSPVYRKKNLNRFKQN